MKDIDSIEISQILEEADEDMLDARRLGGRSAPAARYAASQSAEKYLRALCEAVGRPAGIMWDILKIHDTVGDIAGLGAIRDSVELLSKFTTPARSGDGATAPMKDVLHSVETVRWAVRKAFGIDEPAPVAPESGAVPCVSSEVIDSAVIPVDDDLIPTILPGDASGPDGDHQPVATEPVRPAAPDMQARNRREPGAGRSPEERNTSFVKTFLVCDRCGVRIPRTRQTATGRVPCAMCGRPMKLQR